MLLGEPTYRCNLVRKLTKPINVAKAINNCMAWLGKSLCSDTFPVTCNKFSAPLSLRSKEEKDLSLEVECSNG